MKGTVDDEKFKAWEVNKDGTNKYVKCERQTQMSSPTEVYTPEAWGKRKVSWRLANDFSNMIGEPD